MTVAQTFITYRADHDTAERTALVLHFARPSDEPEVRAWRAEILDRMRHGEGVRRRFVLDVYEATMVHHRDEALEQVRVARRTLYDPIASGDEHRLADARSVAQWWGPLAGLERTHLDALRSRRYLGYEYCHGVALFRLAQRLSGGSAT